MSVGNKSPIVVFSPPFLKSKYIKWEFFQKIFSHDKVILCPKRFILHYKWEAEALQYNERWALKYETKKRLK